MNLPMSFRPREELPARALTLAWPGASWASAARSSTAKTSGAAAT